MEHREGSHHSLSIPDSVPKSYRAHEEAQLTKVDSNEGARGKQY